MASREFPPGWHHVAATRTGGSLKIFVDGQQVAKEGGFLPTDFNLSNKQRWQIGFGPNDYFRGRLSDVRVYGRALTAGQIADLAMQ